MGNTYEVYGFDASLEYVLIYAGESRENALGALWDADKNQYGCLKLEYRP